MRARADYALFTLRCSNSAHLGGSRELIAAAGGTRAFYFRRHDKLLPRRCSSNTCKRARARLPRSSSRMLESRDSRDCHRKSAGQPVAP